MLLTINGLEIKISAADDVTQRWRNSGQQMLSACGFSSDSTRLVRKCWTVSSCFADCDSAEALLSLLQGRGTFIRFANGLDGSNGVTPAAAPNGAIWNPGAGPFAQVGFMEVQVPSANALVYPVQASGQWTIFWREGLNWDGFALTSDGNYYQNGILVGAVNPAAVLNPSVAANGDLNLETLAAGQFAHVVLLRYDATGDQLEQFSLSQAQGQAFSDLPYLRFNGELLCGEDSDGLGFVNNQTIEKISLSAGAAAFQVEFDVCCVDAEYACLDNYDLFNDAPVPVVENLGGFAFGANYDDNTVLDPDGTPFALPIPSAGVRAEAMWGRFDDAGNLSWVGRARTLTSDAFNLGSEHPSILQLADGSIVVALRTGAEAELLAGSGAVMATIPHRNYEALVYFRVSADGENLVWGPKEVHYESGASPTQLFLVSRGLVMHEDESRGVLYGSLVSNGASSIDNGVFAVGDPGWAVGGPVFPDISQPFHIVQNDAFQRLPYRLVFDMVTGDPLFQGIDGPRPNETNFSDSVFAQWPASITRGTLFGHVCSYASQTEIGAGFALDLFNSDITLPRGVSPSQLNTGISASRLSDGAAQWAVTQPVPGVVNAPNQLGGWYIDAADNVFTSAHFQNAAPYPQTVSPGPQVTPWSAEGRAHVLYSLDSQGEIRWTTRLTHTQNDHRVKQHGVWPLTNGNILYGLGVESVGAAEDVVIDPTGYNQTVNVDGNNGAQLILLEVDSATGSPIQHRVSGLIADRPGALVEGDRDFNNSAGIFVRPAGEIVEVVQSNLPDPTLAAAFDAGEFFIGIAADPDFSHFVVERDPANLAVTSFKRVMATDFSAGRFRAYAR